MTVAKEVLKRFVKAQQTWPMITGRIKAVSGELCDVDPSDGGPTLYSVRIKPAVNDAAFGVIAYPKVGSTCVIGQLDGDPNKYTLLQCERIDHLLVKMDGGSTVELRAGGVVAINGDEYAGLVKVNELKQELAKVNAFLSTLRSTINSAPGGGDVAPFKSALTGALSPLELPTYQNIENPKVKHGSA